MNYLIYDNETYPDIFTCTVYDCQTGQWLVFEVSERVNNIEELRAWLAYWSVNNYRMGGFNNIGFDYPILHEIYTKKWINDCYSIYVIAQKIIDTPFHRRFENRVPEWNHIVPQLDLLLINHFDNKARTTSLKQLEFVMRSPTIEDLPFKPGHPIGVQNFPILIDYNKHDVKKTYDFFVQCWEAIEFRDKMSEKMGGNYLNYNDTKIGKQYFIEKLQENGVDCFKTEYDAEIGRNRKVPIQTHRSSINLGEIIFPYIQFQHPEFIKVFNQIRSTVITETKGALKLSATVNGFQFDFGLGGIHGSTRNKTFTSNDEYCIFDWDVSSYYPNIAIANRVYPEHLSEVFCDVYEDVYKQRQNYPKGSVENKAMKLALNGVYGDSNSTWSSMFDPKYTMTITVNGQLMLCMLAEKLMSIADLQLLQINTDGLTIRLPRRYMEQMNHICEEWQRLTNLTLENVEYRKFAVRDVNNYIAVTTSGKVKYKGAYIPFGAHEGDKAELGWHQNHSALVIQKAATEAIVNGVPVRQFILGHKDVYDFFMLCKVRKVDRLELYKPLMWGPHVMSDIVKVGQVQNTSRYYVAKEGYKLVKTMPPIQRTGAKVKMIYPGWDSRKINGLNKNYEACNYENYELAKQQGYVIKDGGTFTKTSDRNNEVEAGYLCQVVNNFDGDEGKIFSNINYEYYIKKAEELVNNVMN